MPAIIGAVIRTLARGCLRIALSISAVLVCATVFAASGRQSGDHPTPWTRSDLIDPEDLVKSLSAPDRPTIVYVGFKALYHPGHIPGATFHGPASQPEGLDDLKRFAQALPRSAMLVIYCGCCPFEHCPNVTPAFSALRAMGFTKVRILDLPANFATDWVEKGYPVDRQ